MDSNHRLMAYETIALPLSYRAVILVRTERIELSTTGWKPITLPLRHARFILLLIYQTRELCEVTSDPKHQ